MPVRNYLPSTHFIVMSAALFAAGGLVAAAQYYTSHADNPSSLFASSGSEAQGAWQDTLAAIEAEGSTLPEPVSEAQVQELLSAARSKGNITDTISRSLLVQVTAAGSEGLGSDAPTQDKLVAAALAELEASQQISLYTAADLRVVADSPEAARSYGNATIEVFNRHPQASVNETVRIVSSAMDQVSKLDSLALIGVEYQTLTRELTHVATPKSLAPLHVSIINNFARMSASYKDMALLSRDPLRGLAAFQQYLALVGETGRVFTSVAENFNRGGVLFAKEEAGSAWNNFLYTL